MKILELNLQTIICQWFLDVCILVIVFSPCAATESTEPRIFFLSIIVVSLQSELNVKTIDKQLQQHTASVVISFHSSHVPSVSLFPFTLSILSSLKNIFLLRVRLMVAASNGCSVYGSDSSSK